MANRASSEGGSAARSEHDAPCRITIEVDTLNMAKRASSKNGSARKTPEMLQKSIYFTYEEWEAVRKAAFEEHLRYSEVVRKAVCRMLGVQCSARLKGDSP